MDANLNKPWFLPKQNVKLCLLYVYLGKCIVFEIL